MDGVSGLDAALVGALAAALGELLSGSKRRRRTISNPSSALAGRQEASTRPTALRSRSSAARPRSPPTSTSSTMACGEPVVSEAGSEITSRQSRAILADSVRAWAKVKCVSKLPPGRSLWSWSCRAYATHSSMRIRQGPYWFISSRRTSPGLVARSSSAWTRVNAFFASAGPPSESPSCQASSPQRVRTIVPSGLVTGLPGEMRLPTSTTRFTLGSRVTSASLRTSSIPRSSPVAAPEKRW